MSDTFGIRRFSCKNCDYATCDRSSILKHRREKCPEVEGYNDNILVSSCIVVEEMPVVKLKS